MANYDGMNTALDKGFKQKLDTSMRFCGEIFRIKITRFALPLEQEVIGGMSI